MTVLLYKILASKLLAAVEIMMKQCWFQFLFGHSVRQAPLDWDG